MRASWPISGGLRQRIALLAIVLFSALSLAALGPHPWDDQPVARHVVAFAHNAPDCPLCDFTAHTPLVSAPPPPPTLAPAIAPAAIPLPLAAPHARFAPRPIGRAPPLPFV